MLLHTSTGNLLLDATEGRYEQRSGLFIQHGTEIIPVEVKAGTTGRLKSLHVFLLEKHRNFALRFNADVPSITETTTVVAAHESKPFHLLSLPLYMVGQTNRLIKEAS